MLIDRSSAPGLLPHVMAIAVPAGGASLQTPCKAGVTIGAEGSIADYENPALHEPIGP